MEPPLAPVDARPEETTTLPAAGGEIDAEIGECRLADSGKPEVSRLEVEMAGGDQTIGKAHPQRARPMVVAEPRMAKVRRHAAAGAGRHPRRPDRKSTRLNSSH